MKKQGSIRRKMHFVFVLLMLLVVILAGTGVVAIRLYRDSVLFVSHRSHELPVFIELTTQIAQMRTQLESLKNLYRERDQLVDRFNHTLLNQSLMPKNSFDKEIVGNNMKIMFVQNIDTLRIIERKCEKLIGGRKEDVSEARIKEWQTLRKIAGKLNDMKLRDDHQLDDAMALDVLGLALDEMHYDANQILGNLQVQLSSYSDDIRAQYRLFLVVVITVAITSGVILAMLLRLMYVWVFRPLRELVAGSQMVAQGRFNYRIKIDAQDELSQLADAFNQMTEQFEAIRNDLDFQVQSKSKELVRTERLASVGFLAAGVAHEINNPLASIAMSAESLQRRVTPLLDRVERNQEKSDRDIIERYLVMIQEEAFRCKGITEKLLDFARTERKIRERTNLSELITGIVEMLNHLGKYRGKHIRLDIPPVLFALVNPQEMKQVTLNLLTNALDSIDEDGTVWIRLFEKDGHVHFIFEDDGCGMESEILQNVFEPFFTKRKNGQGTGLGLSITHRIITEHQGRIDAYSSGPGQGAVFQVEIPLSSPEAERLAAMKSKEVVALRYAS